MRGGANETPHALAPHAAGKIEARRRVRREPRVIDAADAKARGVQRIGDDEEVEGGAVARGRSKGMDLATDKFQPARLLQHSRGAVPVPGKDP